MSDLLLECSRLSCGYAVKTVLDGIDLKVERGETIALLGPNGSGKSTLLKAICRSLPIHSGEIHLQGENLKRLRPTEVAKRAAFVPQEEEFRFEFTVRDVVTMGRLPLSNSLWDTKDDVAAATEAMEAADCLHLQDRSAMELSGGEKQRVLIARALAQGASLMLFDEPTSHLDVEHQLTVASLVRGLASQGRSTIAAIHDLNLATLVADRALLLQDGKIGMDAPTEEVLESRLLDEVYRVRFERTKREDGRLVVLPLESLSAS